MLQPDDPPISACHSEISAWMKEWHLQVNFAKTELLVIPANPFVIHNLTIHLGSTIPSTTKTVRNLRVVFDDQLNFTAHISSNIQSSRFVLYNMRNIRLFLSKYATQLVVHALIISRLDYCSALLAGFPTSMIKPLQIVQNMAASNDVTPLLISLHWLPVAIRIKFKALTLAFRTENGTAPPYFNSLIQVYVPFRSLSPGGSIVTNNKVTLQIIHFFCSSVVECSSNLHLII
ncbi:uncharacterized protein LOC127429836 [Myxocyprinus asiaticus]|uniref:uncharacterized protein LOC127429836 n=1 Tax=Myxocyprinus asiaticus TaxID=70543 RepID=UPI002221D23D|nr:uncharacterized protein LOC127429836 [Myxocyprinus asiaticus]